ncbi:uncharacterized protein L969DRAFT_526981 [Mixia osmundae IAM 14324]|uniref:uncharacterized protein n=1 Tax=Mixia osmundae (strain CBS 9802 / IAM 14324 / JCM 22182 / KY 12970) TaxID=764103 RepID=UPI0004A55A20|nr:uncharacterized protein L969DRAFT_526981 [Mixia osmundae IAM 14324]KEI38324.1 hypothetical protein L969DRAFT_526981 [Mixia osmundae IAM 14324]
MQFFFMPSTRGLHSRLERLYPSQVAYAQIAAPMPATTGGKQTRGDSANNQQQSAGVRLAASITKTAISGAMGDARGLTSGITGIVAASQQLA